MTKPTAIELTAETDRARARRFFLGWLIAATAVSIGGNAAHAVLELLPMIAVKIAVACLPPVVALVAVHGVAVLASCGQIRRAGVPASGGWVYGLAVGVTGLLALGAAALSFTGLYSVAVAGGINPQLALIWPVCIDAGIAVSTVALVVLRPASAADLRAARAAATPGPAPEGARTSSATPTPAEPTAPARSPRTAGAPAVCTTSAPSRQGANSPALQSVPAPNADTSAVARALVDGGATTKSLEQVEQVLEAHAAGAAITRIATDAGVHHATVRKIINAATKYGQLATVG